MPPTMDTAPPGKLRPVPRFQVLSSKVPDGPGKMCYASLTKVMNALGRAVQLGQHRSLIESLSSILTLQTLVDIVAISMNDEEVCTAFSVYLTTLEQAYHWPREDVVETPNALHDHKLVIQVLHHPELKELLYDFMGLDVEKEDRTFSWEHPEVVAQSALNMARWMIEEVKVAREEGKELPRMKQDRVNLLYRTCRGDWFDQGDYRDRESHKEFGRLHEVVRTNGTQRRVQEIFEQEAGLAWLQRMPTLLTSLPASSDMLCEAFLDLQVCITLAREDLFSMTIDETIWGRTFAKFSKAVGVCNVSAGGADCPMFRMLDALCGKADEAGQAALLDELDFRSRFFPPNIRALINSVAGAPSIRKYVSSDEANYGLTQAFMALQQLLYDLYEMHRKKAMRISLALRAGQLSTSSGTQAATSPELHIATTLGKAMDVRFGTDPEALKIDAYACASPLLYGADRRIEAARIRFMFSSPLAVSPGDTISMSVQLKDGEWHTRTYSITHTDAHWKSYVRNCQAQVVGSVEVCVRNRGMVSSYLCSQQAGFPVRVAIRPAPHFRIHANSDPNEETFFIAQGGAVGIFLAWLIRQERLVGKYKLIIGARDARMLPYASRLYELAERFRKGFRIVVGLSKPNEGDVEDLLLRDIKAYKGRVTGYLGVCDLKKLKTTYVCGSSAFGLAVAKCLEARQSHLKYAPHGPRLSPVVTSHLPDVRMHVAAGADAAAGPEIEGVVEDPKPPKLRDISKAELALHNSPGDLWIALGDRVYDISTASSFHPGGEKVLIYRAGRQAGDVFNAVHSGSYEVDSLVSQMLIGKLSPSKEEHQDWEQRLDKIVELQNDLTNHSRFEQAPTGSGEQLIQAPPADVIRNALNGFVKSWAWLLSGVFPGGDEARQLKEVHGEVGKQLDEFQKRTYMEAFDDVEHCAGALRQIFDIHNVAIGKIHAIIDDIKRDIFACLSADTAPRVSLLQYSTSRFVRAIEEMKESFKE